MEVIIIMTAAVSAVVVVVAAAAVVTILYVSLISFNTWQLISIKTLNLSSLLSVL